MKEGTRRLTVCMDSAMRWLPQGSPQWQREMTDSLLPPSDFSDVAPSGYECVMQAICPGLVPSAWVVPNNPLFSAFTPFHTAGPLQRPQSSPGSGGLAPWLRHESQTRHICLLVSGDHDCCTQLHRLYSGQPRRMLFT